ncbi:MAG: hypothetical protein PHQ40_12195 [Anaerolineaceae bacterium]|nr:hypothetical protein [Anaerolineaceae bacterium]
MVRKFITRKPVVFVILVLQFIPLILFPSASFSPDSQEWWLPVLLAILVLIADVELIFQQRDVLWPWYLVSFSQGINVISRLMMIMPHATMNDNGVQVANIPYLVLTVIAMTLSAFLLWYSELPDVRMVVLRDVTEG